MYGGNLYFLRNSGSLFRKVLTKKKIHSLNFPMFFLTKCLPQKYIIRFCEGGSWKIHKPKNLHLGSWQSFVINFTAKMGCVCEKLKDILCLIDTYKYLNLEVCRVNNVKQGYVNVHYWKVDLSRSWCTLGVCISL